MYNYCENSHKNLPRSGLDCPCPSLFSSISYGYLALSSNLVENLSICCGFLGYLQMSCGFLGTKYVCCVSLDVLHVAYVFLVNTKISSGDVHNICPASDYKIDVTKLCTNILLAIIENISRKSNISINKEAQARSYCLSRPMYLQTIQSIDQKQMKKIYIEHA